MVRCYLEALELFAGVATVAAPCDGVGLWQVKSFEMHDIPHGFDFKGLQWRAACAVKGARAIRMT